MREFRLVHVGVAAVLGAATVTAIGLVQLATAAGSGTPSVFVPITPCRLIDTRAGSDNVGTRATPIGSNEAATFAVWGTNGHCTIPNTATGIATNTTAVNPTAGSFLTVYPADASPRPTASNLNFTAGSPPTPNQVTVGLSAAGAIGVYNLTGTVDIIVDIVGYYQRESSAGPTGSRSMHISGAGFVAEASGGTYSVSNFGVLPATTNCFSRVVDLPNGAIVTLLSESASDTSASAGTTLLLWATPFDPQNAVTMASIITSAASTPGAFSAGNNSINQPTINNASNSYSLEFCGGTNANFLNADIGYTLP
ncbi:MAG TPA: hypothetical protein VHN36_06860 [Ilumatobacteraceae bacterium]|nr:hypothetical protein [Ilumatobacteraceae bacterium]